MLENFMRRILSVSLALPLFVFALLMAGCDGGNDAKDASGPSAEEKVFNYVNVDEPKHLDPAFSYDVYEGIVSGLLFDGLVNFGTGTDVVPGLAETWEISDDRTSYTFYLREAKFSNGKPVTAEDVKYSFTRLLLPETNSDRKWVVEEIRGADAVTSGITRDLAGVSIPDSRTVQIQLRRPYGPFLTKIAMPSGGIIPAGSADTPQALRDFDQRPIGAGPWVLQKWIHDQRLEFVPNEHYWGGRPKLDRFVYHVQLEDSVQRQQYKVGKIDQYTVGFSAYAQWIKDANQKAELIEVPELNTYFFAFNNAKITDPRVRQAIAHGIDVQTIFDRLQLSRGTRAHGPVPVGVEGYRPGLEPREYDPLKARALLAEAGVKDLTIQLWIRQEAQTDEMAASAKADLAKIGVNVEIVRRDLAAFREGLYNGEPDMYYYSWWLDYPDMENALEPTFHSRNIPRMGNGSRYSNPDFDRLIEAAAVEPDEQKRIEMLQRAEDIIIADVPWVFLYHRKSFTAVQPWVKNYEPVPLMINASKYLDVDIDLERKRKGRS